MSAAAHRKIFLLLIISKNCMELPEAAINAEFGCVELEAVKGRPEVFVIGGNGSGIPVYRKLQRQGIPFAAGVLHKNDADYQVANVLAADVTAEEPFQCITEEHYEQALDVLKSCSSGTLSPSRFWPWK